MDDIRNDNSDKIGSDDVMQCLVRDVEDGSLDPAAALDFVSGPAFGGMTMFVGKVRENNLGREVTGVSYDLFEPLVLKVFEACVAEAREAVGEKLKVHVSHAKGRLAVGAVAVVVAVATPHRDEAFRACRLIIEKVKHQAPIWKQEHYIDGDSVWSEGCSLCETAHEHRHD